MKQLAKSSNDKTIDLIHCVPHLQPEAQALLETDAKAANVHLHLLIDSKDGLLDGPRLRLIIPDWKSSGVWFCGPSALGQTLRHDLKAHGLEERAFHQELFNMR